MTGRRYAAVWIAFLLLTNHQAVAALGLGPGITKITVNRGNQTDLMFTAMTDAENADNCTLSSDGEIKEWLTFYRTTISISPNSQTNFKAHLEVPKDTPNGVYTGTVAITSKPKKASSGFTGMSVLQTIGVKVIIEITGPEKSGYKITQVYAPPWIKSGKNVSVEFTVVNSGDTWIRPFAEIELVDSAMNSRYNMTRGLVKVQPSAEDVLTSEIPTDALSDGEYWLYVNTSWRGEQLWSGILKFNIVSENETQEIFSGSMLSLDYAKSDLKPGEQTSIKSEFRNSGSSTVNATMVFRVRSNQNLDEVRSSQKTVEPGEKAEYAVAYVPKTYGFYEAESFIEYGNTRTESRRFAFTVIAEKTTVDSGGAKTEDKTYWQVAAVVLLLIICVAVLYAKRGRRKG